MLRNLSFSLILAVTIPIIFFVYKAPSDDRHLLYKYIISEKEPEQSPLEVENTTVKSTEIMYFVGELYNLKFQRSPDSELIKSFYHFSQSNRGTIVNRASNDIYLIYTDYSCYADGELPVFIGYQVTALPEGKSTEPFEVLTVPVQSYRAIAMKGDISTAAQRAWRNAEKQLINRAFKFDMEIYKENRVGDFKPSRILVSIKDRS